MDDQDENPFLTSSGPSNRTNQRENREIPGMFFDRERNKYFAVGREHDAVPVNKQTVQAAEWQARRERLRDQGTAPMPTRRRRLPTGHLVGALQAREQGRRLEPSCLTHLLLRSDRMRHGVSLDPSWPINAPLEGRLVGEHVHYNHDRNGGGLMSLQVDHSQKYVAWGGAARDPYGGTGAHICFHLMRMDYPTRWTNIMCSSRPHNGLHEASALDSTPDGAVLLVAWTRFAPSTVDTSPSGSRDGEPSAHQRRRRIAGGSAPRATVTGSGEPFIRFMSVKEGAEVGTFDTLGMPGNRMRDGRYTRATACALSLGVRKAFLGAQSGDIWEVDIPTQAFSTPRALPGAGQSQLPAVPLVQACCPAMPHVVFTGTNSGKVVVMDLREPESTPPALVASGRLGSNRVRLGISSVRPLSSGDRCVVSNLEGDLDLLDLRSSPRSHVVQSYLGHFNARGTSTQVHINEMSNLVYATSSDNITRLWSLSTGTLLNEVGVTMEDMEPDLSPYPTVHPIYWDRWAEGRRPRPVLFLVSLNKTWTVDLSEEKE